MPHASPASPISGFLASLPLFANLESRALERLASGATAIDAPKAAVVARRGDPCHGFHVVVFGQIKLALQAPRGDEKVVDVLDRGESFGEAAMFVGSPYRMTATALSDSKLVYLSKATVLAEIVHEPQFAHFLIDRLSRRLNSLIDSVEGYLMRSGTERVIDYLLAQLPERRPAEPSVITFPARKGVIASKLNLTQEHFSRILHDLAAAGVIEVNGPAIRVLDPIGLQNRAAA
jgi:CRP/FNR family transcriptional regulator, dissimilatory nitrate respiration regulator